VSPTEICMYIHTYTIRSTLIGNYIHTYIHRDMRVLGKPGLAGKTRAGRSSEIRQPYDREKLRGGGTCILTFAGSTTIYNFTSKKLSPQYISETTWGMFLSQLKDLHNLAQTTASKKVNVNVPIGPWFD
jgi:hypothetical protein